MGCCRASRKFRSRRSSSGASRPDRGQTRSTHHHTRYVHLTHVITTDNQARVSLARGDRSRSLWTPRGENLADVPRLLVEFLKMSSRCLFLLATLLASASGFAVSPAVRAPVARSRSAALSMQVDQEEKKGLFGLFGGKKEVEGKVVPTKDGASGEEEELPESKQMMQKVKDAGVAGIISYVFWEWAFCTCCHGSSERHEKMASFPLCR